MDIGIFIDITQLLRDSKEPKGDFKEFLMGEVRYASLAKAFPEAAEALFEKTQADAMERLENYKKLANQE